MNIYRIRQHITSYIELFTSENRNQISLAVFAVSCQQNDILVTTTQFEFAKTLNLIFSKTTPLFWKKGTRRYATSNMELYFFKN